MSDPAASRRRARVSEVVKVTVLAPTHQDAKYCQEVLHEHSVACEFVTSIHDLTVRIRRGAGVVLVAQEFLTASAMACLRDVLQEQPSWSDIPVLVLLAQHETSARTIADLLSLGHVTLIERPLRIALLVSTLQSRIRDRMRQYEVRDLLCEAQQASESKSAFLANMSHEIRTPMTSILGYAELMSDLVEHADALTYLSTIRRNGEFLLGIINDILDLSKIEAGKLDIDIQRFDLTILVEEVRSIMEVRANENGLHLEVEYVSEIPKLIGSDPKRLKQILVNLVGNAVKFTKRGGGVKLRVSFASPMALHDRGSLSISVSDTGIGMTEAQRDRLFKPFSQGDSAITQQFGGTGLGLDISQRLAAMLGGKILVDSEVDLGSTFTLTIAVQDVKDAPYVDGSELGKVPRPPVMVTEFDFDVSILIVDDRRDIRFLSKHILSQAGAKIYEAEDGLIAVEKVVQSKAIGLHFDLILLDMQMPNMDGYETATALRKIGYEGPIIALTAGAMQGDMSRCLEAGCNDYLSKPIDKHKMLQMVFELLSSQPKH